LDVSPLVLQNYTLGNPIDTNTNYVSWFYQSDLLTESFSSGGSTITGVLENLPGPADVEIQAGGGVVFFSSANGFWCAGFDSCAGDEGVQSSWSVAATPLPAALPLFATDLGGLGLLGWRRKRKAQAA
jgi:hypothetical protein